MWVIFGSWMGGVDCGGVGRDGGMGGAEQGGQNVGDHLVLDGDEAEALGAGRCAMGWGEAGRGEFG